MGLNAIWDEAPVDVTAEANFIWSIANKLRGSYMPDKYGDVIIPMVIIRRFECTLEKTKQAVVDMFEKMPTYPYKAMCKISGFQFYNTSQFDLKELCNDADNIAKNFNASVTNMNDTGALDFVNCLKINSVQYAYLVRTGCQPKKDDVLISKDGTIGKTTVVSDNNFVVASSLVIIRPNQLKIRPKYLEYCLMSNIVQEQLLSVLSGSALKRVSIEKNANLKFVYTYNMTTQQQIIDYLDSKCSEIDALLQNYKDQIATLEEYKKSLIYEYVTGKKEVPAA